MTVSIIVPVYGVERYIRDCAESLFSQTYEDIEYIFCDDCTPDRSMEVLSEVIAEYPDRKVRIIRNEQNKGLGGTRKRLIGEIQTDYFMIVDSDDMLPANAVEILVDRMKQTHADIVDAGYAEYAYGKTGEAKLPCHDTGVKYLNKVLCNNLVSHRVWGKLYKSEVLKRVPGLFVEGIDYAEDVCATCRLVAKTTRSWTDKVVYYYRNDNISSYTKNVSEKNIRSYLRCNREIYTFYHNLGTLPLAAEIGILNGYRKGHRLPVSIEDVDEIINYTPVHWSAKIIYLLLHSKNSLANLMGEYLYRVERRLLTI